MNISGSGEQKQDDQHFGDGATEKSTNFVMGLLRRVSDLHAAAPSDAANRRRPPDLEVDAVGGPGVVEADADDRVVVTGSPKCRLRWKLL